VAGVPLLLTSLLLLGTHNNPAASVVATDSAVTNVIAGIGFPWAPAVVMVSTGAGVPVAVVVLTPVVFSGFPAVTKVSAVAAITTAVDMLSAADVSKVSGTPAVVDIPAFFCALLLLVSLLRLTSLLLMSFPLIPVSLQLVFSDVPDVFCTAVSPSVYVVLSAVNLSGGPASASCYSTSFLLLVFPQVLASLLLFASPAVPVV
jgi:hypothetical protein